MTAPPISVLHIGAGRYPPADRTHATFDIWRHLAGGFGRYTVVGRSTDPKRSRIDEGNISVHLLASRTPREAEFLASQFAAVPIGLSTGADVTVSQCPALGGLAGLRLRRKNGAKLLVELHGLHYFTDARIGSADWLVQKLSAYVFPRADRIRVLSEGMRERLLEHYGGHLAPKITCVPPRVDLEVFRHSRADWRIDRRPRIAMVGGVNDNKGQRRLIEAVIGAGIDAEIWLLGDGPGLDDCRAAVASLGAGDRVRFFGRRSHVDIAELLPQADVLVVFSRREATPRAIIEAMAAGIPVITVNVGFCADIVADGVEGFVLGDDPTKDLVQRLGQLFADEGLRSRLGQAGRARAEREYDARLVFERYRALIRDTAAA